MKIFKNKNQGIKFLLSFVFGVLLFINLALAADGSFPSPNCDSSKGLVLKAGICVPKAQGSGILASTDIVDLAKNIFNILSYVGGVVAVLFVIIGGYQYLTSGGNDEAAEKGKKTVTNALIGLVLIILAFTIVNVLTGTFSMDTSGGGGAGTTGGGGSSGGGSRGGAYTDYQSCVQNNAHEFCCSVYPSEPICSGD